MAKNMNLKLTNILPRGSALAKLNFLHHKQRGDPKM